MELDSSKEDQATEALWESKITESVWKAKDIKELSLRIYISVNEAGSHG